MGGIVGISVEVTVGVVFSVLMRWQLRVVMS